MHTGKIRMRRLADTSQQNVVDVTLNESTMAAKLVGSANVLIANNGIIQLNIDNNFITVNSNYQLTFSTNYLSSRTISWSTPQIFNKTVTLNYTPINPTDAATKAYVDTNGGNVILAANNIFSGINTFNKTVTLGYTPVNPTDAATKSYVDQNGGNKILSSNNVWTGTNSFNNSFTSQSISDVGSQVSISHPTSIASLTVIGNTTLSTITGIGTNISGILGKNTKTIDPTQSPAVTTDSIILDTVIQNLFNFTETQVLGFKWRAEVVAAAVGNVNLAAAPISFDGVGNLTSGVSRILAAQQTLSAQNGVYIWNGTGNAMTRSTDMNTWDDLISSVIIVLIGGSTLGDTVWICNATAGGTINVTPVQFTELHLSVLRAGNGITIQSGTISTASDVVSSSTNLSPLFNTGIANKLQTFTPIVQASNTFYASPNGATGNPVFRGITPIDVPILNQNTTGNAATASIAASILDGVTNAILYQKAPSTTDFISSASNAVLATSAGGTPSLVSVLPAVNSGNTLVTDPTTNTNNVALNTVLANISAEGGNAAIADNLSGEVVNSVPYQTAAKTTGYILPVNNAILMTTNTGVPSLGTVLPVVNGSNVTSLNASNINSGTIQSKYLPIATAGALGASSPDALTILANNGQYSVNGVNVTGILGKNTKTIDPTQTPVVSADTVVLDTVIQNLFNFSESQILGFQWRAEAAAFAVGNINLALAPAPGSPSLDNVVNLTSGVSRILAAQQTLPAQNGVYIWNGTNQAMTRSTDMNTWDDLISSVVIVGPDGGQFGDTIWICTVKVGGTINVTPVQFTELHLQLFKAGTGIDIEGGIVSVADDVPTTVNDLSPLFDASITKNVLNFSPISTAANLFYASPNGAAGNPSFRQIVAADAPSLQPALGYTPVQQGGGPGQGSNKINLGWNNSQLLMSVDGQNQGAIITNNNLSGGTLGASLASLNVSGQTTVAKFTSSSITDNGSIISISNRINGSGTLGSLFGIFPTDSTAPFNGDAYIGNISASGGIAFPLTGGSGLTRPYINNASSTSVANTNQLVVFNDFTNSNNIPTISTNTLTAKTTFTSPSISDKGTSITISNASLTGIPTAPTAAITVNNTQIATTAFVNAYVAANGGGGNNILPTNNIWTGTNLFKNTVTTMSIVDNGTNVTLSKPEITVGITDTGGISTTGNFTSKSITDKGANIQISVPTTISTIYGNAAITIASTTQGTGIAMYTGNSINGQAVIRGIDGGGVSAGGLVFNGANTAKSGYGLTTESGLLVSGLFSSKSIVDNGTNVTIGKPLTTTGLTNGSIGALSTITNFGEFGNNGNLTVTTNGAQVPNAAFTVNGHGNTNGYGVISNTPNGISAPNGLSQFYNIGWLGGSVTNGNISTSGDVVAFNSSDIRLKKDVTKIEKAMDKLTRINGVTYAWIDNDRNIPDFMKKDREAGVIAQEVEAVLPEVVVTRPDGYKAVDYERMCSILIEALKEVNERVKILEGKII